MQDSLLISIQKSSSLRKEVIRAMASYYPSFNYMGLNSLKDKNLVVAAFDADSGESDAFLGMDCIYTENAYGTRRLDYGAKYNSVATIKISVIKANRSDFTVAEVRDFLKWTTGALQNSYLDLLIGDVVKFSFLGRITSAYQQKLDARTIGMSIEFTSVSPYAYSTPQTFECSFGQELSVSGDGSLTKGDGDSAQLGVTSGGVLYNGRDGGAGLFQVTTGGIVYIDNSIQMRVDNETDDLYSYINLDMVFRNTNSPDIFIRNVTIGEETVITGLSDGEIVTLSSEQFIISSIPNKIFGTSFNFVWPRLVPGVNEIVISGSGIGSVSFSYRYPVKIGDCAIDIYLPNDGDCVCTDNTSYGNISWDDIADTPTTIDGYGIVDAYTSNEVDDKLANISVESGITIDEQELDDMLVDVLS